MQMSNEKECRKVDTLFNELQAKYPDVDLMKDGILDAKKYWNAKIRVLWILKQDYYASGSNERPYAERLRNEINKGSIKGKGTWPAMSLVSYGLLSGERDFSKFPDANECADFLFETAIIEVDKELGESYSFDQVILDGFQKYKDLVFLQIDTYKPDVVIVCMPESIGDVVDSIYMHCHETEFTHGLPNVIIGGADVAIGKNDKPLFLWAYHPQATRGAYGKGIANDSYTNALLEAYDKGCACVCS